jgi:hypothetical protein
MSRLRDSSLRRAGIAAGGVVRIVPKINSLGKHPLGGT